MGLPTTRTAMSARTSPDLAYRRWVLRLWRRRAAHAQARASRWLVRRTQAYRRTVAYWQDVMGVRRTPTRHTAAASASLAYRAWVYRLWRNRAQTILRKAKNPPYESQWLCIHRYEGSWQDSGAPYWGGLQMSLTFQQRYGGFLLQKKGTADHWTPLEQMWVAARAVRSGRGFYPWPRTARMCGLI
jgi:CubicO group peptidase (beta-lactamase class C family)